MAREQGTFIQSVNYELQKEGTIDARQLVDVFADLLNFDASNYITKGFPVTVREDSTFEGTIYKKGWYQFLGGGTGNKANWEFMGISDATGDSDKNYIHEQNTPSNTWVIDHNLSKYPSVDVIDSSGQLVEGEVTYNSLNRVTIMFNGSFTGVATCN